MTQTLAQKNAIIYGAGGSLGGAIARTFAREGARVFLAGRTRETLEAVAADIAAAGGRAEADVVDALDEAAVEAHFASVVERAGRVDVSFNLITRGDVQGIPLVDMTAADLTRPVTNGLLTTFLTARAAARQMAKQGGGVILSLTSGSSRAHQAGMGGTGPADAAVESFLRYLAAETGSSGVRVIGIHTAAVTGTLTKEKLATVSEHAPDPDQVEQMIAQASVLRRAPQLADVTETAAFLASDRAAGLTGTIVNVTSGLLIG
ncbi:SDR family oxidoreductase [Streptosporangiaceae bacterium NEAU-GS5]|nr:SDR family oxidoreductase [Streptosporangiaceae bacterium NEAU-GS5]